jgi:hypothetical protein
LNFLQRFALSNRTISIKEDAKKAIKYTHFNFGVAWRLLPSQRVPSANGLHRKAVAIIEHKLTRLIAPTPE